MGRTVQTAQKVKRLSRATAQCVARSGKDAVATIKARNKWAQPADASRNADVGRSFGKLLKSKGKRRMGKGDYNDVG
jgi:hypothetical protein